MAKGWCQGGSWAHGELSKQGWVGESEWGGVVLVAKGVGQWCLIGHGVSLGVEGTQGQVVVKGMGIDGSWWQAKGGMG